MEPRGWPAASKVAAISSISATQRQPFAAAERSADVEARVELAGSTRATPRAAPPRRPRSARPRGWPGGARRCLSSRRRTAIFSADASPTARRARARSPACRRTARRRRRRLGRRGRAAVRTTRKAGRRRSRRRRSEPSLRRSAASSPVRPRSRRRTRRRSRRRPPRTSAAACGGHTESTTSLRPRKLRDCSGVGQSRCAGPRSSCLAASFRRPEHVDAALPQYCADRGAHLTGVQQTDDARHDQRPSIRHTARRSRADHAAAGDGAAPRSLLPRRRHTVRYRDRPRTAAVARARHRADRDHALPSRPRRRSRGRGRGERRRRLPGRARLRAVRARLGLDGLAGADRRLVRHARRPRVDHARADRAGPRVRLVHPLRARPRAACTREASWTAGRCSSSRATRTATSASCATAS